MTTTELFCQEKQVNSHPTGAGVKLHHNRPSRRRPDRFVDEIVQQVLRGGFLEDGLGSCQDVELGAAADTTAITPSAAQPPPASQEQPRYPPMMPMGRGEEGRVHRRVVERRRLEMAAAPCAGAGRFRCCRGRRVEGMCHERQRPSNKADGGEGGGALSPYMYAHCSIGSVFCCYILELFFR